MEGQIYLALPCHGGFVGRWNLKYKFGQREEREVRRTEAGGIERERGTRRGNLEIQRRIWHRKREINEEMTGGK